MKDVFSDFILFLPATVLTTLVCVDFLTSDDAVVHGLLLTEQANRDTKEPLINYLCERIAALGGAQKFAYLIDMSRFLRSVRLTLHLARLLNQRFPKIISTLWPKYGGYGFFLDDKINFSTRMRLMAWLDISAKVTPTLKKQ